MEKEKLKILFIWPSVSENQALNFLPLGIGYLAANLSDAYEKKMLDCALNNFSGQQILKEIADFSPSVVAFSVWRYNSSQTKELAKLIKDAFPDIILIAGGPEPSAAGKDFLTDNPHMDYLIMGEGENTFPALLGLVKNQRPSFEDLEKLDGICFKSGDGAITVRDPKWHDIENIKYCDYDFINFKSYLEKGYSYGFTENRRLAAPILATRGCPYMCEYCSARKVNGLKVRMRAPESIIDEIKYLKQNYNISNFNIIDDNFTFNIDFAKKVCRAILELGMKDVTFCSPNGVRMEKLDEELLGLMKNVGWEWVFIAPESGSAETLKNMRKGVNCDLVKEKIKLIKSMGLKVFGFFIIGYPGEKIRDILKTIYFAVSSNFDSVVFTCFQPLPGTPVYQKLKASGELESWRPARDYYEVTYAPRGLSPFIMKILRFLAIIFFYMSSFSRIKNMLRTKSLKSKFIFLKNLLFS